MPDDSVDAIITDPPYGIDFQSRRRDKATRFDKISNDKTPFIWWLYDAARIMRDKTGLLCFTRWDVQQVFIDAISAAGLDVRNVIVWDKQAHGSGNTKAQFAPSYETIIFATKGKFEFPNGRPNDIISVPKVGANLIHPNEKPVQLLEWLVEYITKPKDLVFDPFAGSGTTLVAAAKSGRKFYGIEIDKEYAEIAESRAAEYERSLFYDY